MLAFIKTGLRNYWDSKGIKTKRKIVVIESDDWGSIRMPSIDVYRHLSKKHPASCKSLYQQVDTLESPADMEALFHVLSAVKDKNGKSAKLTANVVTSNPDFERIKASGYTTYHHEDFTVSLSKLHGSEVFNSYEAGIASQIFVPQFHGRDHVDVSSWLSELQQGNQVLLDGFAHGVYCLDYDFKNPNKPNLMAALDHASEADLNEKITALVEGTVIFKRIFGYGSKTFIAPSYTWNKKVEKALLDRGVSAFQGIRVQKVPTGKVKVYKKKFHYMGEKNAFGQTYFIRNAFFEPTLTPARDAVGDCLTRIAKMFAIGKPAIIGSHRLNFIGSLNEGNRNANLKMLSNLLSQIVRTWPDVEFLSSDELISLKGAVPGKDTTN